MAYTGVFIFGDSLVDAGNALKLAQWYGNLTFSELPDGAPTSDKGYVQGRFTNGFTFADLLSNKFVGLVSKPVFPYGFEDPWIGLPVAPFASEPSGKNLNFAYGGAQIRQGSEVVPDLDGQVDVFRDAVDGRADPGALYIVTIGGNDVRSLAPSGSDPALAADAYAALDRAADKMITELTQLVQIGVHHLLITGVPDVGLVANYDRDGNLVLDAAEQARADAATDYSIYLDTLIRTKVVPALENLGAAVTFVSVMDYTVPSGQLVTGALNANLPTIATLNGLTAEELKNNILKHQGLIFFDGLHPTAQVHALVGAYAHAQLTGAEWIEILPLVGADVDYRMDASISVAGEVDKLVISLVAGTTYTFEMLGISSLATAGSLGDPSLRLLGPGGNIVAADGDSGAGFDARLTFTAASTGTHTMELSATGSLTGSYAFQAAVSGAAMLAGNSYTVSNPAVLVLEGAGGAGQDVVRASVSYALAAGSEIEVLRTTNDKGKTAISLTGNEFDQTIVGNSGSNRIDGKGGDDLLRGNAGKDTFIFSSGLGEGVDLIADFSPRDDTIALDDAAFAQLAVGNLPAGAFARGPAATQADDRIIYDPASGKLYFDPDGIGGADQVHFATLASSLNVTASDFVIV